MHRFERESFVSIIFWVLCVLKLEQAQSYLKRAATLYFIQCLQIVQGYFWRMI